MLDELLELSRFFESDFKSHLLPLVIVLMSLIGIKTTTMQTALYCSKTIESASRLVWGAVIHQ